MNQKECQNQVKERSREAVLFYCLGFKEYLCKCPLKCSLFTKGTHVSMNDIYQGNYEMECPHFHVMVQITPLDEKLFICGELGGYPDCQSCPLETDSCFEKRTNHI